MGSSVMPFGIRSKVTGLLAGVLACTLVLGVFSLRKINQVDAAANEMREEWLPLIEVASDLAKKVEAIRADQATSALNISVPMQAALAGEELQLVIDIGSQIDTLSRKATDS